MKKIALFALILAVFSGCEMRVNMIDECWADIDCGGGMYCSYGSCYPDWDYCYYYDCGYSYYDPGYYEAGYYYDDCPYDDCYYQGPPTSEYEGYSIYDYDSQTGEEPAEEEDECVEMYGEQWFTCPDDADYCCTDDS